MPERIEIEGEAVQLVRTDVIRTVKLTDWLETWTQQIPLNSGILPRGCRTFARNEEGVKLIIEEEPRVRRVNWSIGDEEKTYKLAFPFVEFVFSLNPASAIAQIQVFYRNSPIQTFDDVLFVPCLRNLYYPNCTVCTGQMNFEPDVSSSICEKAESFIAAFWSSGFNDDLEWSFEMYKRKYSQLASVENWEKATLENSLFPLEIHWNPYKTVKELL